MSKEPTYIEYAGGTKIDIMDVDEPVLLDELVQITEDSNLNKIKSEIKYRIDNMASLLEKKRGPIKDGLIVVSSGWNKLEKIQGPSYEIIEDSKTKNKYIRYARSIEFID